MPDSAPEASGPPRQRRYVAACLGCAFLLLAALAGNNVAVDPDGYLPVPAVPGFNELKYLAEDSRTQKSIRLASGEFDTLIAGTSRALVGLDPADPALAGRRVYNASLRGTNLYEIERVLEFAREHQDIELLVWGLDLLTFSAARTVRRDFERSLFHRPRDPSRLVAYLLSADTLSRSWETVRRNRTGVGRLEYDWRSGFLDRSESSLPPRARFARSLVHARDEPYADFVYSPDRFERFRSALRAHASDGTRIELFVSPVHARHLEAISQLGLQPVFEQWKRDLVRCVSEVDRYHDARIRLWDFSGYGTITAEPLPGGDAPAGPDDPMRFYWDSSHYKKEVGSRVLARILDHDPPAGAEDFGVQLRPENVEAALAALRRQRERWIREHPGAAAEVGRILAGGVEHPARPNAAGTLSPQPLPGTGR